MFHRACSISSSRCSVASRFVTNTLPSSQSRALHSRISTTLSSSSSFVSLSSHRSRPSVLSSFSSVGRSFTTVCPSGSASASCIPINRIKQHLQLPGSAPVLGTMVAELRQPSVMQLLANAGFDFAIIDNEHGPFSIETIADLTRGARYCGLTPIVRVPDHSYAFIAQSLDSGAQGLMFPRITDAAQVRQLVDMTLFPPRGRRGNALSRGYTSFLGGDVNKVMAAQNAETFIVIQIETAEAVANIDEIVAVGGVDCVLIGPNDLSIALGSAGEQDSEVMRKAISRVIESCKKTGVVPGLHCNNAAMLQKWKQAGMRLLSYNSEAGLLVEGGLAINRTIKK